MKFQNLEVTKTKYKCEIFSFKKFIIEEIIGYQILVIDLIIRTDFLKIPLYYFGEFEFRLNPQNLMKVC